MKFGVISRSIAGAWLVLGLCLAAAEPGSDGPIPVSTINRGTAVDFSQEILPVLRQNCLACHNAAKPKSGLNLETPDAIKKGGDEGPAVVPGNGKDSKLILAASRQAEPHMPPAKNSAGARALTPNELGLIQLWIDQGATGSVATSAAPVQWLGVPRNLQAIYAVALSADGQWAACGRANEIHLYHLPSKQFVGRLADPSLGQSAHRDLVQSLAFSPDGRTLASGGFRAVKLWRRAGPSMRQRIPFAAAGLMRAVAASPDGKRFASGGASRVVQIWTAEGELVHELPGHDNEITALRFSADGSLLMSGSLDKSVRIWNCADGKLLGRIEAASEIAALSVRARPPEIAAAGADRIIRLWNAASALTNPAPALELPGHTDAISALEFFAGGGELASSSADGSVRVWNVEKKEMIRQLDHGGPVTSLAVRQDGKRLLSTGLKSAKLWNLENGQVIAELKGNPSYQEFAGKVERQLAVTKDDAAYRRANLDAASKQRDAGTESLKKAGEALTAASKEVEAKDAQAKKAAEVLAQLRSDLQKLDEKLAEAAREKENREKLLTQSQQAAQAAQATAAEAKTKLPKAIEGKEAAYAHALKLAGEAAAAAERAAAARVEAEQKPGAEAEKVRVDADQNALEKRRLAEAALDEAGAAKAAVDRLNEIDNSAKKTAEELERGRMAQAEAEKQVTLLIEQKKGAEPKIKEAEKASQEAVKNLAKAKDDHVRAEQIVAESRATAEKSAGALPALEAALKEAEAASKAAELKLELARKAETEQELPLRAAVFSRDGARVWIAGDDGMLNAWSAETGEPCEQLSGHGRPIPALAMLGSDVVSVAADQSIIRWNVELMWRMERVIGSEEGDSPLSGRVLALDFSADGRWLATGGGVPSRSGEVKLWNVQDGTLFRELVDAHSDTVFAVRFSPDRQRLATGAADKFLKVSDIAEGKLVRSFEGHTHHVLSVSWNSNLRALASAGADKVLKIWNALTGEQKKTIEGFGKEVTAVQFLDGTNEALAASGDAQIKIVREDGNPVRGFSGAVDYLEAAAATPDGRVIIAAGQDSVLRVWNGKTSQSIGSFAPPARDDPPLPLASGK